jgi:SAM-dependent methyltransferase
MSQIASGLPKVLSHPVVYTAFQYLMGARSGWRHFVNQYIRPEAGMRVLDIGCEPADLLGYLPPVECWGFDISDAYIEHAHQRHGERGHFHVRLLTEAMLADLPPFDVAVMSGVLHHLEDDVAEAVLRLACRALKTGGRLPAIAPCIAPGHNPLTRWLIKADRGQNVRREQEYAALARQVFSQCVVTVQHKGWIPYTHCFLECTRL